jgi:hypothetical protein
MTLSLLFFLDYNPGYSISGSWKGSVPWNKNMSRRLYSFVVLLFIGFKPPANNRVETLSFLLVFFLFAWQAEATYQGGGWQIQHPKKDSLSS